jgi:SRSO17 transposase
MWPRCRTAGEPFVMPTVDVQGSDVEGCMDEFQAFQSVFHECFARRAARAPCWDDMVGQSSPLARQSREPMALAVEGGRLRRLPRCRRETVWEEAQRRWHSHQRVAAELGEPDGVLRFDAAGVVPKGTDAAGVARPEGGTLGQVAHGQVGVCAGEAARQGDVLVEQRLFLPAVWCGPAYATSRGPCRVPDAMRLQTPPPGAAARLQSLRPEGRRPLRSIVADSVSGKSPDCLAALDACVGATAWVAISSATRCWPPRLATPEPAARDQGAARVKRHLRPTASAPQSVAAWAATLPAGPWSRRKGSAGPQGPMAEDLARHRVPFGKDGLPDRTVGLVSKRTRGPAPTSA